MIKASVDQFALLSEKIENPSALNLQMGLASGYSIENKTLAVRIKFEGVEDRQKDFILELTCIFQFESDTDFKKGNDIVISKELVAHLAMHTVGTARGVLICKMEGTQFASYILPTIDVTKLVTSDFVIKDYNQSMEK